MLCKVKGSVFMKKNKIKLSILFNSLIVLLALFVCFMIITGFKIDNGVEPRVMLASTGFGAFKFFTVDSNLFLTIVACIFIVYDCKLLAGKIKTIPKWLMILKYVATVSVGVTFFTVFLYLGWVAEGGMISLLRNSNLFLHLIMPVLAFITFLFFDDIKLESKHIIYGLIPLFVYSIYYGINGLAHMKNGIIPLEFDIYGFLQDGLLKAVIVLVVVFIGNYIISYGLYKIKLMILEDNK